MELNFRDKKIGKDDGMDFTKLSLKELREMAKEKGLSGISALRKAELIEELKKAEILSQSVVRPVKPADILNPAQYNLPLIVMHFRIRLDPAKARRVKFAVADHMIMISFDKK